MAVDLRLLVLDSCHRHRCYYCYHSRNWKRIFCRNLMVPLGLKSQRDRNRKLEFQITSIIILKHWKKIFIKNKCKYVPQNFISFIFFFFYICIYIIYIKVTELFFPPRNEKYLVFNYTTLLATDNLLWIKIHGKPIIFQPQYLVSVGYQYG